MRNIPQTHRRLMETLAALSDRPGHGHYAALDRLWRTGPTTLKLVVAEALCEVPEGGEDYVQRLALAAERLAAAHEKSGRGITKNTWRDRVDSPPSVRPQAR